MASDITLWTQNDVKSQKMEYLLRLLFCIELKLSTVVALTRKFHDIPTVIFPWQHNGLQALSIQKVKSEFSPSRTSWETQGRLAEARGNKPGKKSPQVYK